MRSKHLSSVEHNIVNLIYIHLNHVVAHRVVSIGHGIAPTLLHNNDQFRLNVYF